jgi:hypothetical protein
MLDCGLPLCKNTCSGVYLKYNVYSMCVCVCVYIYIYIYIYRKTMYM